MSDIRSLLWAKRTCDLAIEIEICGGAHLVRDRSRERKAPKIRPGGVHAATSHENGAARRCRPGEGVQQGEQRVDKLKDCRKQADTKKLDAIERIGFVRKCVE
jgi:hypothetical protein